ncbi:MAG: hypothetical protein C5B49_10830 [Bdellovibrio sp.]|nr:MAG: hypothetical protein C5B49_10830 [Bdellovibrio sp.]
MPTTRDFRAKKGSLGKQKTKMSHYETEGTSRPHRARRRPGREEPEDNHVSSEDDDEESAFNDQDHETHGQEEAVQLRLIEDEAEARDEQDRVEIHFRGSEMLRSRFPKPFELAEEVATQWVHNGDFENLPIGHPLGQWAAQQGLQRAKNLEKRLMESPTVEKAATALLSAGLKAQGLIEQIRERFNRNGTD